MKYFPIFKNLIVLLLFAVGFRNANAQERKTSIFQVAYKRSSFHFSDEQASPLIYQANLNGVMLGYYHSAPKSRRYVNFQANIGTALPKKWGAREFTLSSTDFYGETTTTKVLHAPTIYIGQLEAGYLRRLKTGGNKSLFAGAILQEWLGYSDNIGFWSTWGLNTTALNAAIQYEKPLSENQKLTLGASFPVLAIVSRMPYSNSISDPERGNFSAFFAEGSQFTSLHQYQRFNGNAAYQYRLNRHWQVGAAYEFSWLHYTQPLPIRAYNQSLNAQINYSF